MATDRRLDFCNIIKLSEITCLCLPMVGKFYSVVQEEK